MNNNVHHYKRELDEEGEEKVEFGVFSLQSACKLYNHAPCFVCLFLVHFILSYFCRRVTEPHVDLAWLL